MEQIEANPALEIEAQLQSEVTGDVTGDVAGEQLFIHEAQPEQASHDAHLKAVIEAVIYITDEPLTAAQIAGALEQPPERIVRILADLTAEFNRAEHGLTIREVAGGYKMATKPEHHEAVRAFVKNLKPPLKLSLAALETLSVVAYKQPITAPEIMEIRGVQGAGVLKTLIDRKLIAAAGRKNVVGKPILYKTTREFLIQFGLKDVAELPTLKEFEELGKFALGDEDLQAGDSAAGNSPQGDSPDGDPPRSPAPVREPGPAPEPIDDPDPSPDTAPEDPDRQPVKE